MYEKFRNANEMSISEYIELLFSATKNGVLNIPTFPDIDDFIRPPVRIETVKMNWTEADMVDAIKFCEELVDNIKKLAETEKRVKNWEDFKLVIEGDPVLEPVWNKYLATLVNNEEDTLNFNDLCQKYFTDDLDDEEWKFFDEIVNNEIENAKKRIGGSVYCYDIVELAAELYYWLTTDREKKPYVDSNEEIIIKLVKAVVINKYSV